MTWFVPVMVLGGLLPIGVFVTFFVVALLWGLHGHRVRGWRVRVDGGEVSYTERGDGDWPVLSFQFDRSVMPPRLFLGGDDVWAQFPEWAQRRRDKITHRIRRSLPQADIRHEARVESPPN